MAEKSKFTAWKGFLFGLLISSPFWLAVVYFVWHPWR